METCGLPGSILQGKVLLLVRSVESVPVRLPTAWCSITPCAMHLTLLRKAFFFQPAITTGNVGQLSVRTD